MRAPAILLGLGVFLLVVPASEAATLDILEAWFNPDLATGFTEFTEGSPTWLNTQSLADELLDQPMTSDWTGQADSWVYYVNGVDGSGGLGFVYQFEVDAVAMGSSGLVRAAFNPVWGHVVITDAGSDGTGSSTAIGGVGWTDGDPASIERSDQGHPAFNFTTGILGSTDGNRIDPGGNQSALIWLETDATLWMVSGTALLDSGNHGDVAILGPLAPEPSVAVFLAIGALAMTRRRRR